MRKPGSQGLEKAAPKRVTEVNLSHSDSGRAKEGREATGVPERAGAILLQVPEFGGGAVPYISSD